MKQSGQFLLFTREEFKKWLFTTGFNRRINLIQNHHTWAPSYSNFNGSNHFTMLNGMKSYHVNSAGYSDIAQNATSFPDGLIAICRSFEKAPAGIYGANSGALCIEHVGNFDDGKDIMTEEHKKSIIFINAMLCERFKLDINTDTIIYHNWYDMNTGKRLFDGQAGSRKTCPGTNFFGGNSISSCAQFFLPLVKNIQHPITVNEGIKVLNSVGIIGNPDYWTPRVVSGNIVQGEYVNTIILRFVAMYKICNTFEEAVQELKNRGIINSPDYWNQNSWIGKTINGEYAAALIINMANYIKK